MLRDLATGTDFVLGNVGDFDFDKKGDWLVSTIDASGQIGNGVRLRDMKTGAEYPVETGKAAYRSLSWNEENTAFTVTKAVEDAGYEGKWISIIGFTDLGPKPAKTVYDPKDDKDFPKDMAISAGRGAAWTDSLDGFTFAITEHKKKTGETAPAPKPADKKEGTTDVKKDDVKKEEGKKGGKKGFPAASSSPDAKPDLVVWHWKDERLQPMQEKQAVADRLISHSAIYWTKDKKFVRLSDENMKQVSLTPKQKYAIGRDTKPYEYMSYLNGKLFTDVFVIDVKTGAKKKVVESSQPLRRSARNISLSPSAQFLYYRDGHYHVYDMAAGKDTNITEHAPTSFINVEDDHNFDKPATPAYGWSRDGKFVLLSDGWDIWQVAANGNGNGSTTAINLTVNGKKDGIRYRGLNQFEAEPKPGIDLTLPMYTSLYGEWTKKDGIGRIDPSKAGVNVLVWSDCSYGFATKARNAETFVFTRQTAIDYPDYYLTDGSFKNLKKVTDANPQQKDYLWTAGTADRV